jgi:hypothetical protein
MNNLKNINKIYTFFYPKKLGCEGKKYYVILLRPTLSESKKTWGIFAKFFKKIFEILKFFKKFDFFFQKIIKKLKIFNFFSIIYKKK